MTVTVYNPQGLVNIIENVTSIKSLLDGRHLVEYENKCSKCCETNIYVHQIPSTMTIEVSK